MTIFFGIILLSLPFFIVIFYGLNFSKLGDKKFRKKYGVIYNGLRIDRYSSLAFNVIFVLRRMLLAFVCLHL